MTTYIILTADQAVTAGGQNTPEAALAPALLADGVTYVLPTDVLADPAHAGMRDFLAALPTREVTDSEFPAVKAL